MKQTPRQRSTIERSAGYSTPVIDFKSYLYGGPHPEEVAGIISSKTAGNMRDILEAKRESEIDDKRELKDRFE